MSSHLQHLAKRVEDDPFFLACFLKLYAESEGLDEVRLAAALDCSAETLVSLRLCRAPTAADSDFQSAIDQIVTRFPVRSDMLAEIIRRGHAILQLRGWTPGVKRPLLPEGGTTNDAVGSPGTMMAARDNETDKDDKHGGGT